MDIAQETFGPLHLYGIHEPVAVNEKRHTFTIPDGWEALRSKHDGRATGEIRNKVTGEIRNAITDNLRQVAPTAATERKDVANDNYNPDTRFGDFIQTYTGKQFWPMDPRVEDVDIEDIAHALSMQCRYAGHCLAFYSVAEHSVHIASWLTQRYDVATALAGLLHDATEAYLVDVPRPVKPHLVGYKDAEANIWRKAIAPAFGLPSEIPAAVHEADSRILLDERAQNMAPATYEGGWPDAELLGIRLRFWQPDLAKSMFLQAFRGLTAGKMGVAA